MGRAYTLIFVCLCCFFPLFSQPIKISQIEKEWTDSTTIHSFYLTSPSNNKPIQLELIFKSGYEKRILNPSTKEAVFTFSISKAKNDSLLNVSIDENGNLITQEIESKLLTRTNQIIHSPILSYKLNSNRKVLIPSNSFHPDFDTLSYEFFSEFASPTKSDRFGYHLYFINANSDTVISFFKRIKDNFYTYNRGDVPASKLSSGKYKIKIEFYRNNEKISIDESNEFYILSGNMNKHITNNKMNVSSEYVELFSNYTDEELDDLFSKARYISSKSEIDLFDNLTDIQAKRKFMISFWENRLNNESENFDNFTMRIAEVNSVYGTKSIAGFKTDRGKIFLKYGECDDIYISNMSSESKPYEVWYYPNVQNGIYFFFVDLNSFGEYKLIHSTALNEIYNPAQLYNLGIDKDNYRK